MRLAEHSRRLLSACAAAALLTVLTPAQAAEPASRAKATKQVQQSKRAGNAGQAPKAAAKSSKSARAASTSKSTPGSKASRVARSSAADKNDKPSSRRLSRDQVKEQVAARAGRKPTQEASARGNAKREDLKVAKRSPEPAEQARVADSVLKPLTRKQALAEAARRFTEADVDRNGVLSPSEQVAMHKLQYQGLQAQYQLTPAAQPIPQAAVTAALSSLQDAKASRSEIEALFTPLPAQNPVVAEAPPSAEEAKVASKVRPSKQPIQEVAVSAAHVARGATEKALSLGEAILNKGAEVLGQKEQPSRNTRTARAQEPSIGFWGKPLAPNPESLPKLPSRESPEIPKPAANLRYPVEMRSH